MTDNNKDLIDQNLQDLNNGGVDRRGFLKCMAWAGTGLVWTMSGGIPTSRAFAKTNGKDVAKSGDFSFVQISDSHIGFNKPANPDVTATLQTAINKINAMPHKPDFIIHTGDLSQLSKPSEFDTLDQVLKGASAKQIYFVPGEHDMLSDNGEQFLQRFGKVTVLNGHIHQIMQKVEGKVSFHTAMSTAFPQPAPGTAPSAGPMKVPADQLQQVLGITDVNYLVSGRSLAVVDSPLGAGT